MSRFKKAERQKKKLRLALDGPSGSGKTFTALRFAHALGKRIALIDTEHHSASLYMGKDPDGVPFEFDTVALSSYSPKAYTELVQEAGRDGYDVVVVDSLSHAWAGSGGALEQVDAKSGGNKFTAWKDVTPLHNAMVESLLGCPAHVIVTLRTKTEYVLEQDERGRMIPRKIGLKPVQRDGVEYEFDVVCDMDQAHRLTVSKTRFSELDGAVCMNPGAAFLDPIKAWLYEGAITTTTAAAPVTYTNGHATDDQVERLCQLTAEMDRGPVSVALSARGVSRFEELTEEQAAKMIDNLIKKASA